MTKPTSFTIPLMDHHPSLKESAKIWMLFLSHCFYYAVGIAFMAATVIFLGYFLNFYGISDGILAWGSVIFFALLFIASFFALHQSLSRYISGACLREVLEKDDPAPLLIRDSTLR